MLINCEKCTSLDLLKIYRLGEWDEIWITKLLVKDLDKGGKAISGARSIADDGLGWVVGVCIDSYHVGRDVTLPRGSNEHLLSPSLNVLACTLSINKHPGPFDYQVDLQVPALVVASSFFINSVSKKCQKSQCQLMPKPFIHYLLNKEVNLLPG